jgi:hypothetical protein
MSDNPSWKFVKDAVDTFLVDCGIDPNSDNTEVVYLDFFPATRKGKLVIDWHQAGNGKIGIAVSNDK